MRPPTWNAAGQNEDHPEPQQARGMVFREMLVRWPTLQKKTCPYGRMGFHHTRTDKISAGSARRMGIQMKNQQDYINLEREYAEAIGWTAIEQTGHVLLGCPPGGSPHSRDQAMLPQWARSWEACGPLLAKCRMATNAWISSCVADADGAPNHFEEYEDHESADLAATCAILSAALEQERAK